MLASLCVMLFALAGIASPGAVASAVWDHAPDIRALRLQKIAPQRDVEVAWRVVELRSSQRISVRVPRLASLPCPTVPLVWPCSGREPCLAV